MNRTGSSVMSRLVLPALVFAVTLFVGNTFNSLAMGLGTIIVIVICLVIPGFLLKSHRHPHDVATSDGRPRFRIDPAESLRPPQFVGRNDKHKRTDVQIDSNPRMIRAGTSGATFGRFMFATSKLLLVVLFGAACMIWRMGSSSSYDGSISLPLLLDLLAHGCLAALIAIWGFHPVRGHVSMLILGMVLLLSTVAAGGVGPSQTAQTTAGMLTCIGFVLASRWVLMPGGVIESAGGDSRRRVQPTSWASAAISLLTISMLLLSTLRHGPSHRRGDADDYRPAPHANSRVVGGRRRTNQTGWRTVC